MVVREQLRGEGRREEARVRLHQRLQSCKYVARLCFCRVISARTVKRVLEYRIWLFLVTLGYVPGFPRCRLFAMYHFVLGWSWV